MKNATPANAPDTTIKIDSIDVNVQIRQQGNGAVFACSPVLKDADGKAFSTPRQVGMSAEEHDAFQKAIQAAIQAAANDAALEFLARVYGFAPAKS